MYEHIVHLQLEVQCPLMHVNRTIWSRALSSIFPYVYTKNCIPSLKQTSLIIASPCLLRKKIKHSNMKSVTFRVPSGTWKPGKPGDLNIICPGPEMAWNLSQKVRKHGQNKKFSRKPG